MTGLQLLAPLVWGTSAWWPFVVALRRGRRRGAVAWVAGWALLTAAGLPILESVRPGLSAELFPGAQRYGDAMLAWANQGVGCESDPSCFVPQHFLHAGAFAGSVAISAGLLGMVFAAVLFGWMGSYAGALATASGRPALSALLAWHPWAVVRVAAFVVLGVALAEPLARRGLPPLPGRRRWLVAGLVGLLLDVVLKALLAPTWWRLVTHALLD